MKAFWPVYVFVFFGYWIVRGNPMRVYENSVIRMIADVFAVSDFFQTGLLSGVWWYMCLAQIIVLLIPLIDSLCERLGMAVVPIGFLLTQFIPDSIHSKYGGSYLNYFLVILLAAACAKGDVLNKLMSRKMKHGKWSEVVFATVLFLGAAGLLVLRFSISQNDLWQICGLLSALAAFLIIVLVGRYFKAHVISAPLEFLGKHSGNMFMVHAFFYGPCSALVFWSHNAILSYFTLLVMSLAFSISIEAIKKWSKYNKRMTTVTNWVTSKLHA